MHADRAVIAVIDHDDLPGEAGLLQHSHQFLEGGLQGRLFVVAGNDDGELEEEDEIHM